MESFSECQEILDSDVDKDRNYQTYITISERQKFPVIKVILDSGKSISFLIEMDPELIATLESKHQFTTDILEEWNCRVCKNRLHKFRAYVDANGNPIFCNYNHSSRSNLQKSINDKCKRLIAAYSKELEYRWLFKIVTNDTLLKLQEGNELGTGRPYLHYSYTPASISDFPPNFDTKWLQKALTKYTPLINNLLVKVGEINNMLSSCKELKELLMKSVYGKTQVPAVEWFIKILDKVKNINNNWKNIHFSKQLKIIAETICKSPYCEGDSDSAHLGFYHTINGYILDILENGQSPSAVVKMIEERNNPHNYRRKTADPSEGNIRAAEKLCENLVNTIETISQLETHPGCVKIIKNNETSMSNAFAEMRKENNKNKYGSFADRMNSSKPSTANTLSEIIADINSGIITNISIDTTYLNKVYTAHTTLEKNDLSVNCDHLWCYITGKHGFNNVETITHIYHFKVGRFNNIMFIIKNARSHITQYPISGNCMFPEFLAPKHRSCEKAVEKLNKMTNIQIPAVGNEISLGVGTSAGFTDGRLNNSIRLYITSNNGIHGPTTHTVILTHI
tara:strand:- start:188 stop:1885 length:1698 start_codon:yes stop_codon:yes gene_type:complete